MSKTSDNGLRLERFNQQWAGTILGWIASPEELFHWSARDDFPLIDESAFAEWHSDPDISAYVLFTDDEIVAYGEVWFDKTEESAELGRLVVSTQRRRQGFGRLLVERLASSVHETECREIWVRVFPTNAPALYCYRSARFARVSEAQEAVLNAAQRFEFVWMVRSQAAAPSR